MKKDKTIIYIILAIILILIFAHIAYIAVNNKGVSLCKNVYEGIIKYKSDTNTHIAKIISILADKLFVSILILFLFVVLKNKHIAFLYAIGVIGQAILVVISKTVLKISRPVGIALVEETGFGFPSGHSMCAMFFYGYTIYMLNKYIKNKWLKCLVNVFILALIVFVGISRIYLGVHSLLDVCAGFTLSCAFLLLFIYITNKK